MLTITFPDNSTKTFDKSTTGADIAKSISQDFIRSCVAMELDEKLVDLNTTISKDSKVKFVTPKDDTALEILRHSAAHVMAQAILEIYDDAQLTIGPVVKDGFYYDIDMKPISEDDFGKIEDRIKNIAKAKIPFEKKMVSKSDALKYYKNEPYKLEIISELEDETITFYSQGKFTDLCRGPHVPHTGFLKAVKLMKVSGAYWRADQSKAQLQRVYGTAFFNKKELKKYLNLLEEAKKRDHRKIGAQLDLFSFHEQAPGMPFFHPKGMDILNILLDYWREKHKKAGYVETKTPVMLEKSLWERSGHWDNYRENMYTCLIDETQYAIKPMNCPGGMLLYNMKTHSYKDLPIRVSEIGLVHRHELSGVLSGLFRVRAFHQDDAHIFMTFDQIENEILGVLKLAESIYNTFGLGFHMELSTRPKKYIGTDKQWEDATNGLKAALNTYGKKYSINEGDGAFYGPKIDMHIQDALSRTWQCGTIQLDLSLPERFNLSYIGKDNEKHRPVMIHRVIYGSIERFIGILIEHFAGKFPLWMAPVQAIILPINDDLIEYAITIKEEFETNGLRTEVDKRGESLNKKIRDAQLNQIPLIITCGQKEKETGTLSVRTLDGKVKYKILHKDFFEQIFLHIKKKKQNFDIL